MIALVQWVNGTLMT